MADKSTFCDVYSLWTLENIYIDFFQNSKENRFWYALFSIQTESGEQGG